MLYTIAFPIDVETPLKNTIGATPSMVLEWTGKAVKAERAGITETLNDKC